MKQIINWLFALFGSDDLAIDKVPLSWGTLLNSCFKSGKSEPPVPALAKSNLSDEEFLIENGERVAQMVISKHEQAQWVQSENLEETQRGEGGFGSTGVK